MEKPFDAYPPHHWNMSRSEDAAAWRHVLPNFPMGGQMWSRTRYGVCWVNGTPYPTLKGSGEAIYPPWPPESETADHVDWSDPVLMGAYMYWRRRYFKQGYSDGSPLLM